MSLVWQSPRFFESVSGLRQFDHAIVFKVALMVRKYLSSRENRG